MSDQSRHLDPSLSVLDVVSKYRAAEAIFKAYDVLAGECICCQALFDSLETVAARYNLDLKKLLRDLERAIGDQEKDQGQALAAKPEKAVDA